MKSYWVYEPEPRAGPMPRSSWQEQNRLLVFYVFFLFCLIRLACLFVLHFYILFLLLQLLFLRDEKRDRKENIKWVSRSGADLGKVE